MLYTVEGLYVVASTGGFCRRVINGDIVTTHFPSFEVLIISFDIMAEDNTDTSALFVLSVVSI